MHFATSGGESIAKTGVSSHSVLNPARLENAEEQKFSICLVMFGKIFSRLDTSEEFLNSQTNGYATSLSFRSCNYPGQHGGKMQVFFLSCLPSVPYPPRLAQSSWNGNTTRKDRKEPQSGQRLA